MDLSCGDGEAGLAVLGGAGFTVIGDWADVS
jgi:hypothetical protein